MPARCSTPSTTCTTSNTSAGACSPTRRPAAPSAATAPSTCASPSRACSTRWRASSASIPFAVRRANLLNAPTFTDNDLMVNSYGLPECIDWVERESGWKQRKGKLRNGKGCARAWAWPARITSRGASKPVNWTGEPHATVKLKLDFDGSIVVLTGAADIGQGSSTDPGADGRRGAGARSVARAHRHRRQRGGAEGQRLLFVARHLHGRQCRASTPRSKLKALLIAAAARKLDAEPGRHRMPGRALSRRRAGQGR